MTRSARIPPVLIALDILGVVLLAAGIVGLMGAEAVPAVLGQPRVAWTLAVLGAALMVAAVAGIVLALLRRGR